MRFLLPVLIVIFILFLNRTYAYYYDYIASHLQKAPAQTVLSEKPNQSAFILLGDSLMAGAGISENGKNLGTLLYESKSEYQGLKLLNLAVSGATIKDVLEKQLPEAIGSRPEVVFMLIGVNDVHDFTSDKEFEKDYRLIVDRFAGTPAKLTLINIPFLGSNSILLPPWNLFMDFQTKRYNAIIAKIAGEKKIKMVDLYKLSREKFINSSDLYSGDFFHPSDRGYILWSEYINAN